MLSEILFVIESCNFCYIFQDISNEHCPGLTWVEMVVEVGKMWSGIKCGARKWQSCGRLCCLEEGNLLKN